MNKTHTKDIEGINSSGPLRLKIGNPALLWKMPWYISQKNFLIIKLLFFIIY